MTIALQCPLCGDPVGESDDFCESCGTRLRPPPPAEGACPKCGAQEDDANADGYCGRCGYRLVRAGDHSEIEAGGMALVTDRGKRHQRNEDAGALRAGAGFSVLVVCDGVSTTANPDQASKAAAAAVADHFEAALSGQDPSAEEAAKVMVDAFGAAQKAVLAVPQEEVGGYSEAPSSTVVAVVVIGNEMVTANIGDSRAYWIDTTGSGGSRQLSKDDSLAGAAIATGQSPEAAYARRDAHTITRWLGADAPEAAPHVEVGPAEGPGYLLVCSDGLWNYHESPEALRDLLFSASDGAEAETPLEAARRLVEAAIAAGGKDNITVALMELNGKGAAEPTQPPAETIQTPAETIQPPTNPSPPPVAEASPQPAAEMKE